MAYASNEKGDNVILQKWSVLSQTRVGYTTLKSLNWRACNIKCQHVCGPKIIENYQDFFYSNLIILSSMFRPLNIIYAFANEYLNSNLLLKYFRYLFRRNQLNLIVLTMFESNINFWNSVSATRAGTGHRLFYKKKMTLFLWSWVTVYNVHRFQQCLLSTTCLDKLLNECTPSNILFVGWYL